MDFFSLFCFMAVLAVLLFLYLPINMSIDLHLHHSSGSKTVSFFLQITCLRWCLYQTDQKERDMDARLSWWDSAVIALWKQEKKKRENIKTYGTAGRIGHTLAYAYDFITRLRGHATITQLSWKSQVGHEDAMQTALLTGFLWALKGFLLRIINNIAPFETLQISISPHFNQMVLDTDLHCIIQSRMAHIIIAMLRVNAIRIRWWFKGWKHSRKIQAVP